MDKLTARLLDPETFEAALEELKALSVTCNGETRRAHLTLATSAKIIRQLHARLATAKAEGAAEELEGIAAELEELFPNYAQRKRDRAAAIRKGIAAQPPAPGVTDGERMSLLSAASSIIITRYRESECAGNWIELCLDGSIHDAKNLRECCDAAIHERGQG